MRTCTECGSNISHLHGNAKKCDRCNSKIKGKYVPPMVYIEVAEYNRLKAISIEYNRIMNHKKFLERTKK